MAVGGISGRMRTNFSWGRVLVQAARAQVAAKRVENRKTRVSRGPGLPATILQAHARKIERKALLRRRAVCVQSGLEVWSWHCRASRLPCIRQQGRSALVPETLSRPRRTGTGPPSRPRRTGTGRLPGEHVLAPRHRGGGSSAWATPDAVVIVWRSCLGVAWHWHTALPCILFVTWLSASKKSSFRRGSQIAVTKPKFCEKNCFS